MSISMNVILPCAVALLAIAIMMVITVWVRKKTPKVARVIVTAIATIAVVLAATPLLIWRDALAHGAYDDTIPLGKVIDASKNAPYEQKLPDDLDGKILLFYRYTCPDCEKTFKETSDHVAGIKDVYWVSSRSEQGQPLIQEFTIAKVPCAVYVADREAGEFLTMPLSEKEGDEVTFKRDAIDQLVKMRDADESRG